MFELSLDQLSGSDDYTSFHGDLSPPLPTFDLNDIRASVTLSGDQLSALDRIPALWQRGPDAGLDPAWICTRAVPFVAKISYTRGGPEYKNSSGALFEPVYQPTLGNDRSALGLELSTFAAVGIAPSLLSYQPLPSLQCRRRRATTSSPARSYTRRLRAQWISAPYTRNPGKRIIDESEYLENANKPRAHKGRAPSLGHPSLSPRLTYHRESRCDDASRSYMHRTPPPHRTLFYLRPPQRSSLTLTDQAGESLSKITSARFHCADASPFESELEGHL